MKLIRRLSREAFNFFSCKADLRSGLRCWLWTRGPSYIFWVSWSTGLLTCLKLALLWTCFVKVSAESGCSVLFYFLNLHHSIVKVRLHAHSCFKVLLFQRSCMSISTFFNVILLNKLLYDLNSRMHLNCRRGGTRKLLRRSCARVELSSNLASLGLSFL